MRMTEARDGLEVTQDRGMIMVREDTRRRMETDIIRSGDRSICPIVEMMASLVNK